MCIKNLLKIFKSYTLGTNFFAMIKTVAGNDLYHKRLWFNSFLTRFLVPGVRSFKNFMCTVKKRRMISFVLFYGINHVKHNLFLWFKILINHIYLWYKSFKFYDIFR